MKTPDRNERITRWLDGALPPAEKAAFETDLQTDPALRDEVASLEKLGALLKGRIPLERPVPNADFFNLQIREQIAGTLKPNPRRPASAGGLASWLRVWRSPWAIAGAAAVIALGLYLGLRDGDSQTQVVGLYVPDPSVKASVNYNTAAGATVLMLDGLSDFPDDKPISGIRVHHSENDPKMASTTLYDHSGKVLLVMATDAANRPLLMRGGVIE